MDLSPLKFYYYNLIKPPIVVGQPLEEGYYIVWSDSSASVSELLVYVVQGAYTSSVVCVWYVRQRVIHQKLSNKDSSLTLQRRGGWACNPWHPKSRIHYHLSL